MEDEKGMISRREIHTCSSIGIPRTYTPFGRSHPPARLAPYATVNFVIITAPSRLPFLLAVLLAADVIMSTSPRLSSNDAPTCDGLKEHSLTADVLDGVIIEF